MHASGNPCFKHNIEMVLLVFTGSAHTADHADLLARMQACDRCA